MSKKYYEIKGAFQNVNANFSKMNLESIYLYHCILLFYAVFYGEGDGHKNDKKNESLKILLRKNIRWTPLNRPMVNLKNKAPYRPIRIDHSVFT